MKKITSLFEKNTFLIVIIKISNQLLNILLRIRKQLRIVSLETVQKSLETVQKTSASRTCMVSFSTRIE